jgi:hypothetical protein
VHGVRAAGDEEHAAAAVRRGCRDLSLAQGIHAADPSGPGAAIQLGTALADLR